MEMDETRYEAKYLTSANKDNSRIKSCLVYDGINFQGVLLFPIKNQKWQSKKSADS